MTLKYSIYLHVPFCAHRCAYCDFNTYAGQESLIPAYADSLIREINFIGRQLTDSQLPIATVFFGGGTPSLLSAPQLVSIMDALRAAFAFPTELESTIEANPGTTSPEFLDQIHAAGINRISFGVQSANPEELHMLERAHDFFDVIRSVQWARQAGFDNLNLDLIYGLPEQTLERWQNTLRRIVDLNPEHISAYALTLEHGTPFGHWSARGLLPIPDPDLAADMYEWAGEFLSAHGYVQYEISNWAKPNRECRHNLQYWRGLPYLGLGAGAHGYANGLRYSNVLRIKTYIEKMNAARELPDAEFPLTPAVVNRHRQSLQEDMSEYMMTSLRLTREGSSLAHFRQRFGRELRATFGTQVRQLIGQGLLEQLDDNLRLTPRGRLLGNRVFMQFI